MNSLRDDIPGPLRWCVRPIPWTAWCNFRFFGKLLLWLAIVGLLNLTAQNLIYLQFLFALYTFAGAWFLLRLVVRKQTHNWHPTLRPRRFHIGLPIAVISLILCIACVEVWSDSYTTATPGTNRGPDSWFERTATSEHRIHCWRGQFVSTRLTFPSALFPASFQESWRHADRGDPIPMMRFFRSNLRWHGTFPGSGFAYASGVVQNYLPEPPRVTILEFPGWLPVMLTALPPLWWLYRFDAGRRVQRLIRENRCVRCKYDLRATPDRCPECGTLVVAANNQSRDLHNCDELNRVKNL